MIYTTKGPIRAIKRQQYTYEEIKDTVYELIRMTLCNPSNLTVSEEMLLKEDLTFDSLDKVEFMLNTEYIFGEWARNEDETKINTVGDIIKLIYERKKEENEKQKKYENETVQDNIKQLFDFANGIQNLEVRKEYLRNLRKIEFVIKELTTPSILAKIQKYKTK